MPENDELSAELSFSSRVFNWVRLLRYYAKPKPNSSLDLALDLHVWRIYFDQPRSKTPHLYRRELYRIADQFHMKQQKAQKEGDNQLLRRILTASDLLAKRDFFNRLPNIQTKTLFVFNLLKMKMRLEKLPTSAQVMKELQQRGVPLDSETQRRRVREALAPLYEQNQKVKPPNH